MPRMDQAPSIDYANVLAVLRLYSRVAPVTGPSRGLGRAMALALAGAGARVPIADINCEDLRPWRPKSAPWAEAKEAWPACSSFPCSTTSSI